MIDMSVATVLNQRHWPRAIFDLELPVPLKTYSDTLLFDYLGHLSVSCSAGPVLEIGAGGSSYPLIEMARSHGREVWLVDRNQQKLNWVKEHSGSELEALCIDSRDIGKHGPPVISYCHIDGSKDYDVTANDLEWCLGCLDPNGLICQDNYGDNKWPTVTDAVQDLVASGRLSMLLIGDSSIWLCKPQAHADWLDRLDRDVEFRILAQLVGIRSSQTLKSNKSYLFSNSILQENTEPVILKRHQRYLRTLLSFESELYMQMPFGNQSQIGRQFRDARYRLTQNWRLLRRSGWPEAPPLSRDEILSLPTDIKQRLETRGIDLLETW